MGERGGKRAGAGRPRKQHLTVVQPSVAAAAVAPKVVSGQVPDAPALSPEAKAVWTRLAPDAHREGTLTQGTAAAFGEVCQFVVQAGRAHDAVSSAKAGTTEWVIYSRIYMACTRDLDVKMRAFRLAPNGLPMVKDEGKEKPKSALDKLKDRGQAMRVVRGA